MALSLDGKVAVVTGGTRGIGLAIAKELRRAGAAVAICGRSQSGIDRAIQELSEMAATQNSDVPDEESSKDAAAAGMDVTRVRNLGPSEKPAAASASAATSGPTNLLGLAVDVRDPAQVTQFISLIDREMGRLDILVNNAGVGIFSPVAELSVDDWRLVIETNLSGAFFCSRAALPLLRRGGGGTIINISSLAGKNPFAGGAAYNASKFAINGFSEAMMLDHRNDNIRVSYIMPGSVATEFSRGGSEAQWKIAPEDIAEIVMTVLRMPARTLISRVEVRPATPPL